MKKLLSIIMLTIWLPCIAQKSYSFTFDKSKFTITQTEGITIISTTDAGFASTTNPKGPSLPITTKCILNDYTYIVNDFSIDVRKELVATNVTIFANGEAITTDQYKPEISDFKIATESQEYAASLVDGDSRQNGYSFSVWELSPFLYDAETKELYFVNEINLTPKTEVDANADKYEHVLRPDLFDYSDMLNQEAISTYPQMHSRAVPEAEKIEYLVITSNELKSSFDRFVKWKNQKGVKTSIITVDSILRLESKYEKDIDRIKEYICKLYETNGLSYVLIGGNVSIVPSKKMSMIVKNEKDSIDTFNSDLYYAVFDKNDFTWNDVSSIKKRSPDIYVGRICAFYGFEVASYVEKLIAYEKNPPMQNFAKNILLTGSTMHQVFGDNKISDAQVIGEYLKDRIIPYHFTTTMLYSKNCSDQWSFSSQSFIDIINSGINLINFDSHGFVSGWNSPNFMVSDVQYLTKHSPSIVLTSACKTSPIDVFPSIQSALINKQNGGAIAYIGSSGNGYSNNYSAPNDRESLFVYSIYFNREFIKKMLNVNSLKESCLGAIFNFSKSQLVNRHDDNNIHRTLSFSINLIGDPELNVLNNDAKKFNVSISKSTDYKNITIDLNGDFGNIAITDGRINPELFLVAKNTSKSTFSLPSNEPYIVTVIGLNKVPYIYLSTEFDKLHLHDCVIEESITYRATEAIIGKNVVVKSGATLTLIVENGYEILDNVVCEDGAKLVLKHK